MAMQKVTSRRSRRIENRAPGLREMHHRTGGGERKMGKRLRGSKSGRVGANF